MSDITIIAGMAVYRERLMESLRKDFPQVGSKLGYYPRETYVDIETGVLMLISPDVPTVHEEKCFAHLLWSITDVPDRPYAVGNFFVNIGLSSIEALRKKYPIKPTWEDVYPCIPSRLLGRHYCSFEDANKDTNYVEFLPIVYGYVPSLENTLFEQDVRLVLECMKLQ